MSLVHLRMSKLRGHSDSCGVIWTAFSPVFAVTKCVEGSNAAAECCTEGFYSGEAAWYQIPLAFWKLQGYRFGVYTSVPHAGFIIEKKGWESHRSSINSTCSSVTLWNHIPENDCLSCSTPDLRYKPWRSVYSGSWVITISKAFRQ